ncbi:MAG: hypothetical protein AAB394_03880 [Patescibacteria group bacterium]
MREVVSIMRQDVPCWYELSWQSEPPAIILKIRKDFVDHIKSTFPDFGENSGIVQSTKEALNLGVFNPDFSSFFGFENALGVAKDDGDFFSFAINLPCVRVSTSMVCLHCKMMGEIDKDCLLCDGTGKEMAFDQRPLWAITASLRVVCAVGYVDYPFLEFFTKSDRSQLFIFSLATERDMNGSHVTGEYGKNLVQWLLELSQNEENMEAILGRITKAICEIHKQMHGRLSNFEEMDIRAYVHNGGFHISVPGNACGIDPSHHLTDRDEGGYEFCGHNIDSPLQQLSIIAGLAALHDEARKAGY